MSIHLGAEPGQIAPTILLPGDPLRARYIAENMLEDVVCFNQVRGMLGFTGRHGQKPVSVMGTGMGMPTLAIYVHELVTEYNVKTLIRVGTCGALQPHLKVGDLVLPMTSSTNSQINKLRFAGMDFAPAASFDLLLKAYQEACRREARVHVGGSTPRTPSTTTTLCGGRSGLILEPWPARWKPPPFIPWRPSSRLTLFLC